jgi:hypothetical protein
MAPVLKHLPIKFKVLSLNPSTPKRFLWKSVVESAVFLEKLWAITAANVYLVFYKSYSLDSQSLLTEWQNFLHLHQINILR